MAKKPRVHEVASDYAVDSSLALQILKEMGEFVKSPSSTIEVPVARKLRTSLQRRGYSPSGFTALRGEAALVAASFMQDLPRGLPRLIALLAGASDRPATALREALESRCLFFISTGGYQTLPKNTAGQSRIRVDSLCGESGLMLLRNTPSRSEIGVWAPDRGVTTFQSFTLDVLHLGTPRAVVSAFGLRQLKVTRDGEHFVGGAEPFQRLAWAISSIPVRGQSTPRTEEQAPTARQRKRESEPESTGPSLIYLQRPSLDSATRRSYAGDTEPSSRAATRRWSVSGHWRNQWYPSANNHARIWIEEHTSGAPDGEVVKRDRVFVVVPATTSPTRTTR